MSRPKSKPQIAFKRQEQMRAIFHDRELGTLGGTIRHAFERGHTLPAVSSVVHLVVEEAWRDNLARLADEAGESEPEDLADFEADGTTLRPADRPADPPK